MSIDFALRALRYAMPLIAAAIALISLLKKSSDDKNKTKRALRLSMCLVVAALAVTLGIQFLDDMRQERSAEAQLRRNNELLEQVVRGQYPFQNIRASYQFYVPNTLGGIREYEEHLQDVMPKITSHVSSPKYRQTNDIRVAMLEPAPGVMFCQNSPFMPSQGKHPEAARLVSTLNVRVLFYRKPARPEQWPLFVVTGVGAVQPDVEMWFTGGDR